MVKRYSTIQRLLWGIAVGEGLSYLPSRPQKQLVVARDFAQFDGEVQWGMLTSLSLATTASLARGYQLPNIMEHFQNWQKKSHYAPTKTIQTIAPITKQALRNYVEYRDTLSSGLVDAKFTNDAVLGRMLPVAVYLAAEYGVQFINDEAAMLAMHRIAGLTHNQTSSLVAVGMLNLIVAQILAGRDLTDAIENGLALGFEYYSRHAAFVGELAAYQRLNMPDFRHVPAESLTFDGSAPATVEAVVWSLLNSTDLHSALQASLSRGHVSATVPTLVSGLAALAYDDATDLLAYTQFLVAKRNLDIVGKAAERSGRFDVESKGI